MCCAHAQLESITDVGQATAGEVEMRHLGNAFLTFLQTGVVPRPPPPQQQPPHAPGLQQQAGSFRAAPGVGAGVGGQVPLHQGSVRMGPGAGGSAPGR